MKSINYPKVVGWRRLLVTNLLILCFFIGGTASAFNSEAAMQQKMSIRIESATIRKVLSAIQNKSEFVFLISDEVNQELNKKVSVNAQNESIETILNDVTRGTKIAYKVVGRQISIYKSAQQKNKTIKGKVIDEKGEPIIGASITVNGSKTGAITNVNGDFTLSGVTSNAVLTVSYIGFTTKNVKVGGQQNFNITLIEDTKNLDEVVVVGYGSQKKLSLTGSVATTTGASLQKSSSINLSQGMAGRLSGIIVNNRSGEPGNDDAVMLIRGRSTLGDNSPLIIIDGIAGRSGEFSRLTGDEIESVTVLKDASAAIYGSRSANGVILVTTKRGVKSSKPTIEFTYDLGLQQPTRLPKMADAVLYANAVNASNDIDGEAHRYTDDDIAKYADGSDPILYPNTDWYHEVIKSLSAQHKYGVSARGGSDRVRYFVALNGQYQDGIYRKSATDYKQYNLRSNIDFNVASWLKIGVDLSAREQHKDYSAFPSDDYGIFYVTMRANPTGAPYYPNGYLRGGLNPAIMVQDKTGYDKSKITSLNTTLSAKIDLDKWVKGLSIEGKLAYDKNHTFRKNWQTPWTYYSYDEVSETYEEKTSTYWPTPTLKEYYTEWNRLTMNAIINYTRTFAKNHNVSVMLGTEESKYHLDKFNASRLKYGSDAIDEMFAGDANQDYWGTGGSATETARLSYFGRLNYDYMSKYLISFIARYDGSENFPKGNRWGFFPGVSVGWRLSEENFIKNKFGDWLTNLKLRASYGEQGNDNISQFQYLTTYSYSTSTSYKSNYVTQLGGNDANILVPGTTPNTNVTWEVAKTWNIGLDGDIKNGLLSWELEYFKTRRSNILCTRNASIPAYSGLSNLPDENIGIVDNHGIELQLSHSKRVNKDFAYSVKGNFLYAKNKIVYMDETPWGDGYDYLKQEGHPMGSGLYYHVIGINRTADDLKNYPQSSGATLGNFIYEDVDQNKKIDSYDRKRSDLTTVPQIVFGLTLSATYKNFDFMMLLQGQARAKFYYAPLIDWRSSNIDKEAAEKAWTLDNTESNYPRISTRYGAADFYHKDASFLRLKNLEIGYTLPKNLLMGVGISGLRVYIGGYNLLTIDKLKSVDPETDDSEAQNYPQMRVFNAGLRLTF